MGGNCSQAQETLLLVVRSELFHRDLYEISRKEGQRKIKDRKGQERMEGWSLSLLGHTVVTQHT